MLEIKLIQVDGEYKALVMDMSRKDNRLVEIFSGLDKDLVWELAETYIKDQGSVVWH